MLDLLRFIYLFINYLCTKFTLNEMKKKIKRKEMMMIMKWK